MADLEEMRDRMPVWTALSEFFLDTSFNNADYDRIAAVLKQSPYSRAEIQSILRDEVAPAFGTNLFCIAGEWVRWSEDEVRVIMGKWLELQSANGWRAWIKRALAPRYVPSAWHHVASRLD